MSCGLKLDAIVYNGTIGLGLWHGSQLIRVTPHTAIVGKNSST